MRVLDGAGREVPRVLQAERDYVFEERHTPRVAKIKRLEQLPGGGLAVVCEIERTNAVSLTQVMVRTPLRNYEQTVMVCVPGPGNTWRQVRAAEPLFDYSRFADVKKETIDLPGLTNRMFKLVIGQADDKVFGDGCAGRVNPACRTAGGKIGVYSRSGFRRNEIGDFCGNSLKFLFERL